MATFQLDGSASRRQFCAGLSLAALAPRAWAQEYPVKPIRLIIPFPGGFTDTLARMVGIKMSESLGQPVVVEQKLDGSGQIAASEVLRAPADGHALFMIHIGTHAINPYLFAKLSYDPEKDFVPITELVRVPNLLVVSPSLAAQSVSELVALAKSKPQTLFFASPGNGSSGHLAGEMFKSLAGVQVTHVPYKGASESVQDLVTGRVHFMFDSLAQGGALAKAGKVRVGGHQTAQAQLVPRISHHGRIRLPGLGDRPQVWPGGAAGDAAGGGAAHSYRSRQSAQQPRLARPADRPWNDPWGWHARAFRGHHPVRVATLGQIDPCPGPAR